MQPTQSRQGQATGVLPAAHQRALIPPSTLEFPSQRLYALSIFVAAQALKLYDVYGAYWASYPEQYSGVLLKWWLIDTLYMLLLWVVKIPWLQFSGLKTMLLTLVLITFDVVLFSLPSVALSGALVKMFFGEVFGQQIGVSRAKLVNVKDIVYNSSHILGRHTVHILPYGTAKINPTDDFYCIPSNEIGKKDIYIPIVLNNTIPRTITISRFDFELGERTVSEFSGRDIQRATEVGHGKEGLELYYVRLRKPGAYKLENIVSKDGIDVRLYSRLAYIFTCPTARFKPVEPIDHCQGAKESMQLEITGIPPLRVEYTRRIGTAASPLKLDRIQPNDFDSPLTKLRGGLKNAEPAFFVPSTHQNFDWAALKQLSIPLNLTFDEAALYEFQLTKVIDGVGNIVEMEGSKQIFKIHEHPKARFDCSATDPVRLLIGDESTQLPVILQGEGQWNLKYQFTPEDNTTMSRVHTTDLDQSHQSLRVSSPGEYKLLSVSDKYCKGDILYPSACQIIQPPIPSVEVQTTPIPSECAGDNEIGMKFVVELHGTPPFNLQYTVVKQTGKTKSVVERKRERIDRSRHIFSYLPSSSGEYTYEFTSLDDRYYKNRNTNIKPIKQIVHPQPDAKFGKQLRNLQVLRTCVGEAINLDVELSGTGPFKLYWTIGKQMYSDVVDGDKYVISIPELESAGHHVVSLVKIQDANDCIKDLEARDVIIDVRRDRPTAFFYTDDKQEGLIQIAEGASAKLPLRLTGEGPWTVTYRNVDKDGQVVTRRLQDPNAQLEVKDTGRYELLSVRDGICKGDVLPPPYVVSWIDKPTLSIPEDQALLRNDGVYERRPVCEDTSDAIDIQFTGHGPFYCAYDQYQKIKSKREISLGTDEISSGLPRSRVTLRTREHGTYRYVFNKLADQRYTQPFQTKPLVLEQTVHATPTVKYASKSKDRVLCVGDNLASNEMDPIWLEFTGQAPFTVHVRIKHESSLHGKTVIVDNIETNKYRLELPDELDTPGKYQLQLLRVSDANGCGTSVEGANTIATIQALDIATIAPAETCSEICVGDTLEYSLSGVGPFTISYQFNGRNEKIKSQTSKLAMIADRPGNLTIISVGDQRNKCRSFPKSMTKIVHEVPSSLVSGGKEIIENIREGDMVQAVVDLIGTPPFDFEWQRSELIWDQQNKRHFKGRVLESHVVQGVEGHRYYINTSTEGVIEVVSIKDRYCQYPRSF
ncbi:hypothetical protein EC973_006028 [Apophysomyces ossiformis]|uniref:Nucleoporin Pom152 n=1 Tax=Apophysomyces ossiformis TaxID=679940 RepID=A0A8H7BRK6_9FUNG|nr:hypothetical protein EC973_006028 [Apophysomyces ossiformis]